MEKEARYPNVTKKRTQIKTKKIIYAVSSIITGTFKIELGYICNISIHIMKNDINRLIYKFAKISVHFQTIPLFEQQLRVTFLLPFEINIC